MFASRWFWTQEPHIITQIKSMTAMLLQVFRHKADLGHLLCENAKVRGAFSCLELLLWHAAQHSAFSCRPVARCPIVREQKCPKCWVDLQSFSPPTKLVCSTDFIDAYILGDTSRFFPAAFRFLSVTEGILLSTEVRMVRSTWLTGDVLGSGKLPRALGNYPGQRTEVKFGESWEVPSEGTFIILKLVCKCFLRGGMSPPIWFSAAAKHDLP